MKHTSKLTYPAALAALALLAGTTGTAGANGLSAFSTVGSIYQEGEELPTDEECQDAWAQSPAYGSCGDRSPLEGSTAETVEAVGNVCYIATSCEYYAAGESLGGDGFVSATTLVKKRKHTEWLGGVEAAATIENCDGNLDWFC